MTDVSRYGTDYSGQPNGCPRLMYPWDVSYDDGDVYKSFEQFKEDVSYDSLNIPVSWYFNPDDEDEYDPGVFTLVFTMPRKGGSTWCMKLAPGYDRAEVEEWLEQWTKEFAREYYGWSDNE